MNLDKKIYTSPQIEVFYLEKDVVMVSNLDNVGEDIDWDIPL